MSILIKGMEMPKNCAWCRFLQSTDPIPKRELFCGIDTTNNIHDYKPDKGCPLVPVPPHGRLIDADGFFKDICNSLDEMTAIGIAVDGEWMWGKLNDALDNAPTIIEAEVGET